MSSKQTKTATEKTAPAMDFNAAMKLVDALGEVLKSANPDKPKTGNEALLEIVQDETAETTKDYHIIKRHAYITHLDAGGTHYFSFKLGVKRYNHGLATQFRKFYSMAAGSGGHGDTFVVDEVARYAVGIRSALEEHGYDADEDPWSDIMELIESRQEALEAELASRIEKGEIENADFPLLFKAGEKVVINDGKHQVGGEILRVRFVSGFFVAPHWEVKISAIVQTSDGPMETGAKYAIMAWGGLKSLNSLAIQKVDTAPAEVMAALHRRGEKFRAVTSGAAYMLFSGQLVRNSWYGSTETRADGRIMIDAASFKMLDSDGYSKELRALNTENGEDPYGSSRANVKKEALVIKDEDLWRCSPWIFGFSFRAKKWGAMSIEGVSPIKFREDAFDHLVMDEDNKVLIRALVENAGDSFSDVVEGKGGGCIFLLEGEPGQGKTLTAETVAEVLKRPLYPISVGELGTDPDSLEGRLRTILDIATTWNAVLLLDEADIFLEQRDTKDLVRNAMVGVFLRLLEYHDGVLFLTTNRADNIDRAFFSRISVALSFPSADATKRQQIWSNLLKAANLPEMADTANLLRLSNWDINGRQIKNAIRLGQTLAKSEGRKVTIKDIESPLEISANFMGRVKARAEGAPAVPAVKPMARAS